MANELRAGNGSRDTKSRGDSHTGSLLRLLPSLSPAPPSALLPVRSLHASLTSSLALALAHPHPTHLHGRGLTLDVDVGVAEAHGDDLEELGQVRDGLLERIPLVQLHDACAPSWCQSSRGARGEKGGGINGNKRESKRKRGRPLSNHPGPNFIEITTSFKLCEFDSFDFLGDLRVS